MNLMPKQFFNTKFCHTALVLILLSSCAKKQERREVALYNQYCASCHLAPKIEELPKDIWENSVLPDMASRMDIEEMYDDPSAAQTTFRPKIKLADWIALKNYIVTLAPEKLPETKLPEQEILTDFEPKTLQLDGENGAFYTYLEYDAKKNALLSGNIKGELKQYSLSSQSQSTLYQGSTPVTWYSKSESTEFVTEVGILDPSELAMGKIVQKQGQDTISLDISFHRPVHNLMKDLNRDGNLEMVVSEFGNETGRLSLLMKKDAVSYDKKVLLNQPGCIKTLAKDMNNDGKIDLISLTSQGNESITILYQTNDLEFEAEKVLQFRSVWGSSWFELIDYNGDGFDDIITVNGDNADKSYVHKPYHGMRIHLNDGQNNFSETYFYPLNGATRVLSHDFDADGDIDFALISTFPDYDRAPQLSFVYLENEDAATYQFKTRVLDEPNEGRWFLMDKGDVDNDGDMDIFLSSFTYVFTPVPDRLAQHWSENNTDVVVLENKLN